MKVYDVMGMNENLGWCAPYNKGEAWAIICDGKVINLKEDTKITCNPTAEEISSFASRILDDYDEYDTTWKDAEILADGMEENGCYDCPFRDECDAMMMSEADIKRAVLEYTRHTKSEVERYMDNHTTVFKAADFEGHFGEYMEEWFGDYDGEEKAEEIEKHRRMVETGDPLADWDIVTMNGEKFYIMYEV